MARLGHSPELAFEAEPFLESQKTLESFGDLAREERVDEEESAAKQENSVESGKSVAHVCEGQQHWWEQDRKARVMPLQRG